MSVQLLFILFHLALNRPHVQWTYVNNSAQEQFLDHVLGALPAVSKEWFWYRPVFLSPLPLGCIGSWPPLLPVHASSMPKYSHQEAHSDTFSKHLPFRPLNRALLFLLRVCPSAASSAERSCWINMVDQKASSQSEHMGPSWHLCEEQWTVARYQGKQWYQEVVNAAAPILLARESKMRIWCFPNTDLKKVCLTRRQPLFVQSALHV